MKVIVPLKLLLVCNSIVAKLDGEEFSIVTNIESRTSDTLTLSEEYYIPKQRVTSGSIDYLPDDYSHSVVIHRHPNGLNTFSKTDHEYINQNFELSLLYTEEEYFVNGLIQPETRRCNNPNTCKTCNRLWY
jgi:proteasome lid subunit RPN8/RPN11